MNLNQNISNIFDISHQLKILYGKKNTRAINNLYLIDSGVNNEDLNFREDEIFTIDFMAQFNKKTTKIINSGV